eukprot:6681015-Pyramimonas_sp.AAC.1
MAGSSTRLTNESPGPPRWGPASPQTWGLCFPETSTKSVAAMPGLPLAPAPSANVARASPRLA